MCQAICELDVSMPTGDMVASIECPVSGSILPHSAVERRPFRDKQTGQRCELLTIHCSHCGVDHKTLYQSRSGTLSPIRSWNQKPGSSRHEPLAA